MTPFEKAERAKELLGDPILKAAFLDIREGFIKQLEIVPIGDVDTQHEVALSLQILKRVQSQLMKYVGDHAVEKDKQRQQNFIEKMREHLP